VESWLDKILAGQPIPRYELNDTTVSILAGLMERNQAQDLAAELVREDWLQKTKEYKAEGQKADTVT